jgi:hypothetical protein
MPRKELSKKVKTALDETRMLILGAQILLGFEFRAAFSDGFDKLPSHSRHLEALALMLIVTAVALMITPRPYHRIVEGGQNSGAFHKVTTVIADVSLLPFALALGIDVFSSVSGAFPGAPPGLQPVSVPAEWRWPCGTACHVRSPGEPARKSGP